MKNFRRRYRQQGTLEECTPSGRLRLDESAARRRLKFIHRIIFSSEIIFRKVGLNFFSLSFYPQGSPGFWPSPWTLESNNSA